MQYAWYMKNRKPIEKNDIQNLASEILKHQGHKLSIHEYGEELVSATIECDTCNRKILVDVGNTQGIMGFIAKKSMQNQHA